MELKGIFKSRFIALFYQIVALDTAGHLSVCEGLPLACVKISPSFACCAQMIPRSTWVGFLPPKITSLETAFCSPETMITLRLYLISP